MNRIFLSSLMLKLYLFNALNLKCSSSSPGGNVSYVTDGDGNKRCFASITPPTTKPMPILFFFHGSGGNAANCGHRKDQEGKNLAQLATEQGFALVCGEALQYNTSHWHGGQWNIPEIITNVTGTPCHPNSSLDVNYIQNIIKVLQQNPKIYDTNRLFMSGCSMGSGFSFYSSMCIHTWYPNSITSFMTHSTGLKIKGDGFPWPKDLYHPEYVTAECPKCEYFPAQIPTDALKPPMKACIFDNTGDPNTDNPFFYKSSVQLEKVWKQAGNPCQASYGTGGHCVIHSFTVILNCLDDGTHRLLQN